MGQYLPLLIILGILLVFLVIGLMNVVKRIRRFKKYLAEVEEKNQTWLRVRNLDNTSNLAIMSYLFGLGAINQFDIVKIDRDLSSGMLFVTITINDKEVQLSLKYDDVIVLESDSGPAIKFVFNPEYLIRHHAKTWDTWAEEVQFLSPDFFLYQASALIFMTRELKQKINSPIFTLK